MTSTDRVDMTVEMARHELKEAAAELGRHHRDFARISALVHDVFDNNTDPTAALRQIRAIVG